VSGSRLVVLGDALLDSAITGTVNRECPNAPTPVVDPTSGRLDTPRGGATGVNTGTRLSAFIVKSVVHPKRNKNRPGGSFSRAEKKSGRNSFPEVVLETTIMEDASGEPQP
jgi:bifunctional ADP-heptose synthase (sugar kinase/adenylyltransferase)